MSITGSRIINFLDHAPAEIEQAALSPSNVVPGIGFSPDKMLQARIFSHADAHRYRLGTHHETLPRRGLARDPQGAANQLKNNSCCAA